MATTRKSTPKFIAVTIDSRAVVYGPASRTECKVIAGKLNVRGRAKSVLVVPAPRCGGPI